VDRGLINPADRAVGRVVDTAVEALAARGAAIRTGAAPPGSGGGPEAA
jgi:hypothetical protein